MLQGKKIVLGITGSIAAYKAAYLVRALIKQGAEVQIVITPSGKEFITPVTLSALSGRPVVSEFFASTDGSWHSHVDLGLWADVFLVAPATAASLGKMAHGIADNLLLTTYLSMKAPVFIAPAMDLDMYAHPTTQANLERLRSFGNHIIEPGSGFLASKLEGKGRMEEPDAIVAHLSRFFQEEQSLAKKKILITAGPTYEKIDPVRFIGNYSSGKMGYALAEACAAKGAQVILVSGPTALRAQHPGITTLPVESAQEMFALCQQHFPTCHAALFCAAVADYRPASTATQKIKRKGEALSLELVPNPDIAAALGAQKTRQQVLGGFALETESETEHALQKLAKKKLDFIVLNSLNHPGAGFQTDTNRVTILQANGSQQAFPLKSKKEVAEDVVGVLLSLLPSPSTV